MTLLATLLAIFVLAMCLYHITGRDPLWVLIEALVYTRAGIICAGRTVRRALAFYRHNFTFAVEDVRRDARMRS